MVLLFWMVIAGVAGAFWLGTLLAFLWARKRNDRLVKWLSCCPLVFIPLVGGLLGGTIAFSIVRMMIPSQVYKMTFEEAPTADVSEIRSDTFYFGDGGHTYLQFKAKEETFRRLVFPELELVSAEDYLKTGDTRKPEWQPSWWQQPTAQILIYKLPDGAKFGIPSTNRSDRAPTDRRPYGTVFGSEWALMTYDRATSIVQFSYSGFD